MVLKQIAERILPPLLKHIPRNKAVLYPFYLAGHLEIRKDEIPLKRLPYPFYGLSIAYASDIHFGNYFTKDQAIMLCQQLLSLNADIVILGGDYGDNLENSILFFQSIHPFPASTPVLAVLGNHDYGKKNEKISPLLDEMREKNVIPLVNDVWKLNREGKTLAVCAPDDIQCGKPDFAALIEESREADFVIFAPHSPDLLPEAFSSGFSFHLALCGHTHGGQIVLCGRSLHSSSRYGDRYRAGWYYENGAVIHVSSGVGTSILPLRVGTRAEIHRFTLRIEQ